MAKKGIFSWFRRKDKEETNLNQNENLEVKETQNSQSSSQVEAKEEVKKEESTNQELNNSKEDLTKDNSKVKPQEAKVNTLDKEELNKNQENIVKENNAQVEESKLKDSNVSKNDSLENDASNNTLEEKKDESNEASLKETTQTLAEENSLQEELIDEPQQKPGFFKRLLKGLNKTRQNIGYGFVALFKGRKIDEDLFDELETALITSDVGVETTQKIMEKITKESTLRELKDSESLMKHLSNELLKILEPVSKPLVIDSSKAPYVILMVGVNGVGKTTTIGKMAKLFESQGKKVMLAAGDTFRAAAVEQLKVWGQRNHIPVVAQSTGSDSASVIFDAINSAKAKGYDIVIADTAGRLQNKGYLMEELKKIVRVMQKLDPSAPHEVMLTLDAATGQNAISQAKLFGEAVPLTGINLTKLDGTAKGGVIFNIASQFNVPIRFIGVGEGIDDLREFNAKDFVNALFTKDE